MRIILKNLYASPAGVAHVGEEIDTDVATARSLVEGGCADALEPFPESKPKREKAARNQRQDIETTSIEG